MDPRPRFPHRPRRLLPAVLGTPLPTDAKTPPPRLRAKPMFSLLATSSSQWNRATSVHSSNCHGTTQIHSIECWLRGLKPCPRFNLSPMFSVAHAALTDGRERNTDCTVTLIGRNVLPTNFHCVAGHSGHWP